MTSAFSFQILNIDDVTVYDDIVSLSLRNHLKSDTHQRFVNFDKDLVNIYGVISNSVFGHVTCVKTMTS